jgi:hypothetical protein
MNFGVALALLKAGKRVAREGWNGKGMFIYLVGPGRYPPSTRAGQSIAVQHMDGLVPYRPYIAMKTVDEDVVPWVASQTDLLADDWRLAEGETIDFDTIEEASDEAAEELEVAGEDGDELVIVIDLSQVIR